VKIGLRSALPVAVLALPCLLVLAPEARAQDTFSIVAVDPATGMVGSAGASCISGSMMISDVHPGVGAIHTQAYYLAANQAYAHSLMDAGFTPGEIIDSLVAHDAGGDPSIRQYGIVDLAGGGRSAGFTGTGCSDYKNHVLGPTYAIQGNILLGQQVLDQMENGFLASTGFLGDRLMAALQGANMPGADTRCLPSGRPAISAFIRVARPGNGDDSLLLNLNVAWTSAGQNPINILQGRYDQWRTTTGVDAHAMEVDPGFVLYQNHPNPVRTSTSIRYRLPEPGRVRLRIYDVRGREVATLLDAWQLAGIHAVQWDGQDRGTVPGGVYFYRLDSGAFSSTRRMVIRD
jgi:uncharacterized Ntn-hydrolase superfamily protein